MMQELHRPGDRVADIIFNWLPTLDDPREISLKEIAPIVLWNEVQVGDTVDVLKLMC